MSSSTEPAAGVLPDPTTGATTDLVADPATAEAGALAERIAELGPDALSPDAVRLLMTAAITAFGRHLDAGVPVPEPADPARVTATDAVRAASAVLKAVNLETFELALWETWGGTPLEDAVSELYDRGTIKIENLLRNARAQADARGFDRFPIVDVDSHHYEDRRWDEIIPYIEDDSIRDWARAMTQRSGKAGATTITTAQVGNQEVSGRILRAGRNQLSGQADLGAEQRKHDDMARMLWAMDMMGIDHTIMFPTPMLHLSLHPAAEVEVALARAYTRWLTEELLPQDDRIRTLAYLPFNDPEASLRMIEEFGDTPGVVGFMVTSIRYRPVHANEYAPVYAALEERGLPLAFHAAYNWHEQSMTQLNKFISAHALGFSFCNIIHMTNMIVNGIPERFPGLKLLWVESGLAWIPFLMQRLDNEYLMRTSECPLLTKMPSDYMREMFYSTQPMERTASTGMMRESFEMMNAENTLLYSSDYPHWDFDVPSVVYDLPFLTDEARRKILGGNACELFGLPTGKRAPASAAAAGLAPMLGDAVPAAATLS